MAGNRFDTLMGKMSDIARMSEIDARQFVNEVFQDGIVSRGEADALFDLNERLGGADDHWDSRFREAIKDFLLTVESPVGWVDEDECEWLMERVTRDGTIRLDSEIDLLLDVLRYAEGAPERLGQFTLTAICDHAKRDGFVSADNVERLRRALYAPAGDGALWVTRSEAAALFALNDACAHARNASSWNDLFARAIANHLMAMAHPDPDTEAKALARETWLEQETPGVGGVFRRGLRSLLGDNWFENLTYDPKKARQARDIAKDKALKAAEAIDTLEENWLLERLGWDGDISPAERSLVNFLRKEVPGFANGLAAVA